MRVRTSEALRIDQDEHQEHEQGRRDGQGDVVVDCLVGENQPKDTHDITPSGSASGNPASGRSRSVCGSGPMIRSHSFTYPTQSTKKPIVSTTKSKSATGFLSRIEVGDARGRRAWMRSGEASGHGIAEHRDRQLIGKGDGDAALLA